MIFTESMVCELLLHAQEKAPANAEELARKLSNPIAGLISVPLQNNIDYDIGAFMDQKYTLNLQPVIPIQLSPDLNLITRYILPIVDQRDVTSEGGKEFGLSDATISAFFTPVNSSDGLTWGASRFVSTRTTAKIFFHLKTIFYAYRKN